MTAPAFARPDCQECWGTGNVLDCWDESAPCPACLDSRADAVLARAVPIAAHKLLALFVAPDGFGTMDLYADE